MILDVCMIVFTVCFIVDISGFVESVKYGLFRIVKGKDKPYHDYTLKPFDCSLCMSFWTVFVYCILITKDIVFSLFISSMAAFSANVVTSIAGLIKGLVMSAIEFVIKKINMYD